MSQRNSILLIIKQNNGLSYNSLLNKIQGDYSSINSARAALSRTLKDLISFQLARKEGDNIFITDKALPQISSEMRSKLLDKLNLLISSKNNYLEIDLIVQLLQTLIERSKQDKDLFKAANAATNFFVSDLIEIHEKIQKQLKHLEYIDKIFLTQIDALKELEFDSLISFELNSEPKNKLNNFFKSIEQTELIISGNNSDFLHKLSQHFNAKIERNTIFLDKKLFPQVFDLFYSTPSHILSKISIDLRISKFTLKLSSNKIHLIGPVKELEKNLN